jgi:hypothetical protein
MNKESEFETCNSKGCDELVYEYENNNLKLCRRCLHKIRKNIK